LTTIQHGIDSTTKSRMSYSPITIRFTRNADKSQDDVITITPSLTKTLGESWMTEYKVNFTASNCDNPSKKETSINLPDRFLEMYLKSLLTMIEKDSEPYKSVQVDMPLVPSVMYNPQDLWKVTSSILSHLLVLLNKWPTYTAPSLNTSTSSRKRRSHLFFDENGDIESDMY